MVMETIEKVVASLGASDIDACLEELLIDGILYAFQEQTSDDANVMLNGFGTVVNALGQRVKPYLPQICGMIKWRLNNKIAKLMGHFGLYEYLGEEYPEVLGSILGALKAIVNVIADRGAEFVPAQEWMSICFELLEMLKAEKKGIRHATVNTFGYIAKAIGPQDNLKSWRQLRA
ncbi:unnamed protein product [Sphagnum troendelagicum]